VSEESAKQERIKKPPVLFGKTQKLIEAIAKKTGGTFLSYWNSPNGSVCQNDVQGLYEVLQRIGKQDRLHLFLKSGGGDGTASLRIVNLLHRYADHIVVLLPLECASAATMIALGAHEIQMGPLAYLTAVDTSLIHELSPVDPFNKTVSVSQDELNRVVTLWKTESSAGEQSVRNPYAALFDHVHPLVVGAVDRASSLSVQLCNEILGFHLEDRGEAERISMHLNSAYPAHTYPILRREAQRIGLSVSELDSELSDLLLDLHELYSEMGQEAVTDYDERNHHNNEIVNILETVDVQVYFQNDKDWHYRAEERQWVSINDHSSWRKIERVRGKTQRSVLHIR
jgi:hypothetical protein